MSSPKHKTLIQASWAKPKPDFDFEGSFKVINECIWSLKDFQLRLKNSYEANYWNVEDSRLLGSEFGPIYTLAKLIKGRLAEVKQNLECQKATLSNTDFSMYSNILKKHQRDFYTCLKAIDHYHNIWNDRIEKRKTDLRIISNTTNPHVDSYQMQILEEGTKHVDRANRSLQYAQETHQEIQKLEEQIAELHQIFIDASVLCEIQDTAIVPLVEELSYSGQNTHAGLEMLEIAESSVLSSRKKKLLIAGLVLLTIVVVVVVTILVITGVCIALGVLA